MIGTGLVLLFSVTPRSLQKCCWAWRPLKCAVNVGVGRALPFLGDSKPVPYALVFATEREDQTKASSRTASSTCLRWLVLLVVLYSMEEKKMGVIGQQVDRIEGSARG
jgi:hypothetical protein